MEKPRGTLGDLLARKGVSVSTAPDPAPPPAAPPPPGEPDLSRSPKLVLRRERKGRGGKTATVIAGLGMRERDLETLAKSLRRALGCGATVDGDTILLQGDLTTRTAAWLTAHGAKRVVIGN
ncbi:MAG TPA: translation initiation factor [Candidatus Binatia bacterium]|jgi:translation initiation factor 1|nr:translation initiation factor [Candidatus Binatia bacterium]